MLVIEFLQKFILDDQVQPLIHFRDQSWLFCILDFPCSPEYLFHFNILIILMGEAGVEKDDGDVIEFEVYGFCGVGKYAQCFLVELLHLHFVELFSG